MTAIAAGGAGRSAARAAIVTLTGTSYLQTFDTLGTGSGAAVLPAGWDVRTAATGTSLGSPAASVVKQTWAAGTAGFLNVASATLLSSTTSSTVQGGSINRALGVRQTADFGDPGAAFNFQFDSRGMSLTSGALKLMMLDVELRSSTWSIQYGLGTAPTSFTTIGTWADPGTWGTTSFTIDSSSLDAMSYQESVWFRIAALGGSTGSSSRDTIAIDDFQIAFVPEPAASLLGATGLLGLLWHAVADAARRRHRLRGRLGRRRRVHAPRDRHRSCPRQSRRPQQRLLRVAGE